jgi:hypothetical protein
MIKIPDQGGRPKVRKFKGSDIRNNTDVRIELASGAASTRAGQTNMILKLVEQNFFSPESEMDPEFKQEILRRVGLSGFKDKTNADAARAMNENDMIANMDPADMKVVKIQAEDGIIAVPVVPGLFAAMGAPAMGEEGIVLEDDPVFRYDDHATHFEIHRRFILSTEFKYLHPELQSALTVHTDYHQWTMKMEMAKQAMEAAQAAADMEGKRAGAVASASAETGPAPPPPAEPVNGYVPNVFTEGGSPAVESPPTAQ